VTREAGATTGTARNEKVKRGSLEAGGEIERNLDGITSREPYSRSRKWRTRNRNFATLTSVSRRARASERRRGWETGRTPLAGRKSYAGLWGQCKGWGLARFRGKV
jgi:hypothetical protein